MSTWDSPRPPPDMAMTVAERRRAARRFALLAAGLVPALVALVLARGADFVLHAGVRRVSSRVVQGYSAFLVRVIGLRVAHRGTLIGRQGALVANHASWLDIFVLNARAPVQFVAKAEVARWPGIGLLARMAGTVFIRRDRRDATAQSRLLAAELRRGHRLVFFPEGTSTDSTLVLPFKPTLFQAFLAPNMPPDMAVQPISLRYHAPDGADPRFYGWWGSMGFAAHFMRVLGQARQGHVTVMCHTPIACAPDTTRKTLARDAEGAVRAGFGAP